jgi:hypothetical protein
MTQADNNIVAVLPPRSQTLFGNAVRETPFRADLLSVEGRRETEFREDGSQTEFGNQGNALARPHEQAFRYNLGWRMIAPTDFQVQPLWP